MSKNDLIKAIQGNADTLKTYGVKSVGIFGSFATSSQTAKSDIDVLVDLESGRSLLDLGGLLMDLRELLGCRVDVVTTKGLRERIKGRVLKEAVSL